MKTVVAIGESLIDFVSVRPGDLEDAPGFEKAPGGAPANVAACIAQLGGQSAFVGLRGDDPFGAFLEKTLLGFGVDTTHFRATDRAKTCLAFVALTQEGDRSFMFYRNPSADMLLEIEDVPMDFIAASGVLHVGSVALSSEPARSTILHTVREAKRRGVFVSYDPNWRPALWPNPSEGLEVVAEVYPYCDLIKVNREELLLFTGDSDPQKGADYFHRQGIPLVLVTLDADGCYYSFRRVKEESWVGQLPGHSVTVVDTTGAGDAFIGAFLRQMLEGEEFTEEKLRQFVAFAIGTSALVVTQRGAMSALPTPQAVTKFLSSAAKK